MKNPDIQSKIKMQLRGDEDPGRRPSISLLCHSESITFIHIVEGGSHTFQPQKEQKGGEMARCSPSKRTTQRWTFLWPKCGHMTRFDCKEGWARYPQKAPISQKEEEEYEARGRRKRRRSRATTTATNIRRNEAQPRPYFYTPGTAGDWGQRWINPSPSPQRTQSYSHNLKSIHALLRHRRPARSLALYWCLATTCWCQQVRTVNIPAQDPYVLGLGKQL